MKRLSERAWVIDSAFRGIAFFSKNAFDFGMRYARRHRPRRTERFRSVAYNVFPFARCDTRCLLWRVYASAIYFSAISSSQSAMSRVNAPPFSFSSPFRRESVVRSLVFFFPARAFFSLPSSLSHRLSVALPYFAFIHRQFVLLLDSLSRRRTKRISLKSS